MRNRPPAPRTAIAMAMLFATTTLSGSAAATSTGEQGVRPTQGIGRVAKRATTSKTKRKKKSKCKRTEREVPAGTPLLGGPGLGFEVIHVQVRDACLKTLSATDDGSFSLVRFEVREKDGKGKSVTIERAGWIATGLVDEDLSDLTDQTGDAAAPLAEGEAFTVFTIKESVLRDAPRFDAQVVGESIPGGTALAVKGRSSDAQWLRVEAKLGDTAFTGFIAKYQVSRVEAAEGAAPDAGTGTWTAAREGRTAYIDSPAAKASAASGATSPSSDTGASDAKPNAADAAKQPASAVEPGAAGAVQPVDGASKGVPSLPEGPLVGRTQEFAVAGGYTFWHERYASDAVLDPFAAYALNALLGGGLSMHYMYRGDFPLVVGVGGHLAVSGFQVGDPDTGQAATAMSLQLGVQPRIGWRFVASPDVDVEAGVLVNADGYIGLGGPTNYITSSTGVFYQGGPWLSARARLGGGAYGFFGVDAALLAGGYTLFPMPSAAYSDALEAGKGDPDAVNPDGCSGGFELTPRPEDETAPDSYAGVRDETCYNHLAAAPPVHLGIGTDISFRYGYPVLDFLRLDGVVTARVRNANIRGGGVKNVTPEGPGYYSEAANLDVSLLFGAGVTFTF